jgi:hypothetical protein
LPTELPKRDTAWNGWLRRWCGIERNWAVPTLSIPALLIVLSQSLPLALVLPAFSVTVVGCGVLMAVRLFLRPPISLEARERAVCLAGMFLLCGFGASVLTDVSDVLSAFAELERVYAAVQ